MGGRGSHTLVASEGDMGILEEMSAQEVGKRVVLLQDGEDGRVGSTYASLVLEILFTPDAFK